MYKVSYKFRQTKYFFYFLGNNELTLRINGKTIKTYEIKAVKCCQCRRLDEISTKLVGTKLASIY